jgi:hypothetical protein
MNGSSQTLEKKFQQHLCRVQESTHKKLRLHDERELGAIKDGSCIEGNVTMILQKDHKIKEK